MIIEVRKAPKYNYGRYFLAEENNDANNEIIMEAETRRRNVRVNDNTPSEEREAPTVEPGDVPDGEPPTVQPGDVPEDTAPTVEPGDVPDGEPPTVAPAEAPDDNAPTVEPGDVPEDTAPTVEPGDVELETDDPEGDGGDAPTVEPGDVPDEEAPTVEPGDVPEDAPPEETQPEEGQNQQQNKGPGLEYDSTRKYLLFQNFIALNDAIHNYITKLEKSIGDSVGENNLIKYSIDKLREIKSLCYDYMLMKFEISSYVQSQMFYQNLVIMVQMVFDLYNKTRSKIKNQ